MVRHVVQTADGSHSLFVPELDEHYHSRHGALQESRHVFIEMGLRRFVDQAEPIRILEIGFGTGLNALLTALECFPKGLEVEYWTIERYPLTKEELDLLNYPDLVGDDSAKRIWDLIHAADWESMTPIESVFSICKRNAKIEEFEIPSQVDLIYFDAFAPEKQPELWTEVIFQKMYRLLDDGGLLTTYCAKGDVRRAMIAAGFQVKKVQGPPGKREMLIATKNAH